MANRVSQVNTEALVSGDGEPRISQLTAEALLQANADLRISQFVVEVLCLPFYNLRDTLTLTESATVNIKPVGADDTLALTETASGELLDSEPAADTLTLTELATVSLDDGEEGSDTLTLTELATSSITKDVSGDDTISFTETTAFNFLVDGEDTLSLTEQADVDIVYNLSDSLDLTELATGNKQRNVSGSDVWAPTELARVRKTKTVTASDSLVLGEEVAGQYFNESGSDSLSLTELASVTRTRILLASDQLILNDQASRSIEISRTANDNLLLTEGRLTDSGIGQLFLGGPMAAVTKNLVVFYDNNRAVTLPPPLFDDMEAFQGKIQINRFTGGMKRVYKKSSNNYKHTYTFRVNTIKLREFRLFVDDYNARQFFMENHKGERWRVYFANNPIESLEQYTNCLQHVFTIDLIGVRVA